MPVSYTHLDTEVGGKREAASYHRIAEQLAQPAGSIVFLSDVVAELDAARDAALRTVLLDRRDNYQQPRTRHAAAGHLRVVSFAEIVI